MQLTNRLLSAFSNAAIILGIALGIGGIVRGGSLFIAVGTAGIAFSEDGKLFLVIDIGGLWGEYFKVVLSDHVAPTRMPGDVG